MKNLLISANILQKIQRTHGVSRNEVEQCLLNRAGNLLTDNRELRKTNPPTLWFISKTNRGRSIKIVYIQKGAIVELKTAYEPNAEELRIYAKYG